ncbi:MAG: GNAT family N-acetyltransferase [Acidimicrobiales bacterium]
MPVTVEVTESASEALELAGAFLQARPVEHNLLLTLLTDRVAHPQAGRYWIGRRDDEVAGVGFQSPLTFPPTLTPMPAEVARAIAEAALAGGDLPGVTGEAATAAAFAGHWAEICKVAATPVFGQRLYHLGELRLPEGVSGRLRPATRADYPVVEAFTIAFHEYIGEHGFSPAVLASRVDAGQMWLWEDGEPVSCAMHSAAVAGVTRIQQVYTPPAKRRHGYAGACVAQLSERLVDAGLQCVLYAELANPRSNSVSRSRGSRAVVDVLRYRFTPGG